ncbi:hypothetical protein [Streptomyces anulatus]|uniref:hypothetical protein n=1 Tax=Streptomyces anulatus TaxID=1892 RepID=UPI00368D2DBF
MTDSVAPGYDNKPARRGKHLVPKAMQDYRVQGTLGMRSRSARKCRDCAAYSVLSWRADLYRLAESVCLTVELGETDRLAGCDFVRHATAPGLRALSEPSL